MRGAALHVRQRVLWLFRCVLFIFLGATGLNATALGSETAATAVGWSLSRAGTEEWERIEGDGTLVVTEAGLNAVVPPHSITRWQLVVEPIWVYRYTDISLRVITKGVVNEASPPLLSLSPGHYGPTTPGLEPNANPFQPPEPYAVSLPAIALSQGAAAWKQRVELPREYRQIDRITLTVQSATAEAELLIQELQFEDPLYGSDTWVSCANIRGVSVDLENSPLLFLNLPETDIPLSELDPKQAALPRTVLCASVPFLLNPNRTVFGSRMAERAAIRVNVNERCREVFLLLGAYTVGTDEAFRFEPRRAIHEPERLIVLKTYSDGSQEKSFPYSLNANRYVVDATSFCAYTVPANPEKVLRTVAVVEQMSYGEVFLAGITVNPGPTPLYPYPEGDFVPSAPLPNMPKNSNPPTLTVDSNRLFTLENDFYKIELQSNPGCQLTALYHKGLGCNLIPEPLPLFAMQLQGIRLPVENLKLVSFKTQGNNLELNMITPEDAGALPLKLTVKADESPRCEMNLQMDNPGYTPVSLRLRFPDLKGLRLGEAVEREWYLFPRMQIALGREAIRLTGEHRSEFPVQFMDLFSDDLIGGLALHTRDANSVVKQYQFEKDASGSTMAVGYGIDRPIVLPSGSRMQVPATVLDFHAGDWHAPFHSYREWLKSLPQETKPNRTLAPVFLCHRDYPLGGTGLIFDKDSNRYTFNRLLTESKQHLGGLGMIDLAGWSFSEAYGRVGDYNSIPLGGFENLAKGIQSLQTQDVQVSLNFNGYLVDPRAPIVQQGGKAWQILDAQNQPKTWPGNDELFMCPYAEGWQKYLGESIVNAVRQTGTSMVFLDQIGFADPQWACFSSSHGHEPGAHPLLGEYLLMQAVRTQLQEAGLDAALCVDQVPNDIQARRLDAAYNYGMAYPPSYPSPAFCNLLRYAQPSLKVIELFQPGNMPRALCEERAKLAFFHGEGIWLKGFAQSWLSREARQFVQKAGALYRQHGDAFQSQTIDPLIPTQMPYLLANRFRGEQKEIVTLYNAGYQTLSGNLFRSESPAVSVQEEMGLRDFQAEKRDEVWSIKGSIDPHELSFLVFTHAPNP